MITLVTGGAGNGKSYFAENLCNGLPGPKYYLAAMIPFGPDSEKRIEKNQKARAEYGYETIEKYTDIHEVELTQKGNVLLECLCNLTANEMYDEAGNITDPVEKIVSGIKHLAPQCENLIIVTNDVGGDAVFYDEKSRAYVVALGKINEEVSNMADEVIEVVCGIPLTLKGKHEGGVQ